MAGITGKIYQQFAITIATSITFSAINALTLSPALCAIFLQNRNSVSTEKPRFFAKFDTLVDKGRSKYMTAVTYFSSRLKTTALTVLTVILLIGAGFWLTPTSFLPEEDQGIIFVNAQLANTATINQTNSVLHDLADKIMQLNGVKYFISVAGYSMLGGAGENVAV